MLYETISPEQLDVLNKLSEVKRLTDTFYLAGGTALSLELGHWLSYDFDFFSKEIFDSKYFSDLIILNIDGIFTSLSEDTLIGIINGVNISFFLYPYNTIRDFKKYRNINIASFEDIACLRSKAIMQRGTKRDLYDIYEIIKIIPLIELKNYLLEKYKENGNSFYHLTKSLLYFEDAENVMDPISLNGTNWEKVKSYLISNEKKILKAFS